MNANINPDIASDINPNINVSVNVPASNHIDAATPITAVDSPTAPKRIKGQRKFDILQAMAEMLESSQWQKITTAGLANKIGFSEAALYRHYRSKAEMYSGLMDFIDDAFIDLFKQVQTGTANPITRVEKMMQCLLIFAEENKGLTRVLTGEALMNEDSALLVRLNRVIMRIEDQWKIHLREAVLCDKSKDESIVVLSTLMINAVIGAWWRYSKSGFTATPTRHFEVQWALILRAISEK